MAQFENKVALVTGAGSGMGRSTAVLPAQRGAAVTIVGPVQDRTAGSPFSFGGAAGRS